MAKWITFGGAGRATTPSLIGAGPPAGNGSVSELLQDFIHYLGKIWIQDHPVSQDAQALARFDMAEPINDYRMYRRAGREVPVDDGFDLEQSYLVAQLVAHTPLTCLRNTAMPEVPTKRIARLSSLPPAELVQEVFRRFPVQLSIRRPIADQLDRWRGLARSASALVYDGNVGHCVLLYGVDHKTQRVIYWDPWPLRSLLCQENNRAGVAAQAVPTGEFFWTISADELARVLFAVLVRG